MGQEEEKEPEENEKEGKEEEGKEEKGKKRKINAISCIKHKGIRRLV